MRRMLLLGAVFTNEYAIEGAALCNPSIVAHRDQTGTAVGSLRFVMSLRHRGGAPVWAVRRYSPEHQLNRLIRQIERRAQPDRRS